MIDVEAELIAVDSLSKMRDLFCINSVGIMLSRSEGYLCLLKKEPHEHFKSALQRLWDGDFRCILDFLRNVKSLISSVENIYTNVSQMGTCLSCFINIHSWMIGNMLFFSLHDSS